MKLPLTILSFDERKMRINKIKKKKNEMKIELCFNFKQ